MAKKKPSKQKRIKASLLTYVNSLNLEDRREYNKKFDDYNVANGHPGGHATRKAMEKALKKTDRYKAFLKSKPTVGRRDAVGYDEAGEPVFHNDERLGTGAVKYDSYDAKSLVNRDSPYGKSIDKYSDLPEGVDVSTPALRWAWDQKLAKARTASDKYRVGIGQPFATDSRDPGNNPFGATDVDDFKSYAYDKDSAGYGMTNEQKTRRKYSSVIEHYKDPNKYNPYHKAYMNFAKGWLKDNPKTGEQNMTKGEEASMANAYEPSLFTSTNSFNTQATRDVAGGKGGLVGNAKAGAAVYDPKSNTRTKVAKAIKSRGQKLTSDRKARGLDRAKERLF
jgi:hypothetical protein